MDRLEKSKRGIYAAKVVPIGIWTAMIALPVALFVIFEILVVIYGSYPMKGVIVHFFAVLFGFGLNHTVIGFSGSFRDLILDARGKKFRILMMLFIISSLGTFTIFKVLPEFTTLVYPYKAVEYSTSPTSVSVVVGSFLFGVGMQMAGCCASGSLVEIGLGLFRSFIVLIAFIAGATFASSNIMFSLWHESTLILPSMSMLSGDVNYVLAFIIQFSLLVALFYLSMEWEKHVHGYIEEKPLEFLSQCIPRDLSFYKRVLANFKGVSEHVGRSYHNIGPNLKKRFYKTSSGLKLMESVDDEIDEEYPGAEDAHFEADAIDYCAIADFLYRNTFLRLIRLVSCPWESYVGGVMIASLQLLLLIFAGHLWGVMGLYPLLGCLTLRYIGISCEKWDYFEKYATFKTNLFELDIFLMDSGLVIGALFSAVFLQRFLVANRSITQWRTYVTAPVGGILMGIGSRFAYGCNIGALFTGITSFSPSGWVWFLFAFLGNVVGAFFMDFVA